jgi:putative transcriptional regulator
MRGQLLVASPSLEDPNFTRTVVLLLAHGEEEGALGVVLNRPSPAELGEILPQWHDQAAEPTKVFLGGPVSIKSAICLAVPSARAASVAARPVGVEETVAGLVSVDLERDPDEIAPALYGLRVFSGYAGWSAGQLESELTAGGWILTDPLPGELLTDAPESLWSTVLKRLGGLRAVYAKAPPSLSMN